MDQWKTRAAENGYFTRCPWCFRFCKKKLPFGMFLTCSDCLRTDVVLAKTGEPAFTPQEPIPEDQIPWPAKGTPEYEEFCADRDAYLEDSFLTALNQKYVR